MANNRDLNIRLNADPTGFERGMKSAEQSAKVFERELAKLEAAQRSMAATEAAAYREMDQRAAARRDAAAQIGAGVAASGAVLAAGIGAAVSAFADFDAAMSSVKASTRASQQELDALREAALKAGADTQFSATEAAAGINELAKAGVSTQDILDGGLTGALSLAAAGQIDVADAAEVAASAMTQFRLSGESVPHIADLLAAGAGKAQGSVGDLGQALAQSGLVASQMGLSIEDTVGTLSAFASAGLMGSDAGTSFKTMLLALANPSEKAARTMGELGVSAYDAEGNFVGVAAVAEQLRTKLSGLSQEQRDSALATIFGSDAIRAAAILYSNGAAGIEEWTAAVNDQGFAAETAATNMDNLKGDIEQLKGSIETLLITLGGGAISDWARAGTKEVDRLVDQFNGLPKPVQDAVGALGAVVAAGGLLGGAALLVIPKLFEMKETLATVGITADSTRAALARLGTATGAFALTAAAIIAAGYAANAATDYMMRTSTTARDMENALRSAATGADVAGRSFDLFNTQFTIFGDTHVVDEVDSAAEAVEKFGNVANRAAGGGFREFVSDLEGFLTLGIGTQADEYTKYVTELDTALAQMVASGNAEDAAAAYQKFKDAATAEGVGGKEFDERFTKYQEAVKVAGDAAAAAAANVDLMSTAQTEATGTARELSEAEQDLRDELAGSAGDFVSILGAYTDQLEAKTEAERKAAQETAASTESGKDSWEDYVHGVSVSVDEYLAELERQVKAQQDWETNLLYLSTRVSQGTLNELARLGPEGAPLIAQLVNASDEELGRMEALYGARTSDAVNEIADELTNAGPVLSRVAQIAGAETAAGYARELANGTITVAEIAKRYGFTLNSNIPDAKNTNVTVSGTGQAAGAVRDLKGALDGIQSKTVTLRTLVEATMGSSAATGAKGSGWGVLVHKAVGGPVYGAGTATSDSIPALLSNGEHVIRAERAHKYRALLDLINSGDESLIPRFAAGGVAGSTIDLHLPSAEAVQAAQVSALAKHTAALQKAANAAAEAADSSESAGTAGTAAAGGQGRGWQWQIATLRKAFPGLALNSAYRPGAITASGNLSYHARGRAVDVPPRMDVFRWLLANYGNSPEIIYSPAGNSQIKNGRPHYYTGDVRSMHFNHVHWAYDRGGLARGEGFMPKLTSAPERVLSPGQTKSFDRLVDLLGTRYATGGTVTAGARGVAGASSGYDLMGYLNRNITEAPNRVDPSALRAANLEAITWSSRLATAELALAAAKEVDEEASDALRTAESARASAASDVESAARAVTTAEKALAKSRASGDTTAVRADEADLADARQEAQEAAASLTTADRALAAQQARSAATAATVAEAEETVASTRGLSAQATERATDALSDFNAAQAEALAYARKIRDAALSGAGVIDLFSAEDVDRSLRFAQAAYDASVAQGKATTEATEYQSAIDAVADAGAKLAASQAAAGASYATQKATLAATRAEVEALARSYGFTAEQARALADSAVPLANTGETLVDSLTRQLKAVQDFSAQVTTLRALGLSQGLIDQILEAGPEKGAKLAEELIAGGKDMVGRLNALQRQLEAAAAGLGTSAATAAGTAATAGASTGTKTTTPTVTRATRTTKAGGGYITGPGTATSDSIPALLSDGEFVVKAAAVGKYGRAMFESLNAMRYAVGGPVGRGQAGVSAPATPVVVHVEGGPSGPQFYAPLFDHVTVASTADADVLWSRAPVSLGALGLGGGRR